MMSHPHFGVSGANVAPIDSSDLLLDDIFEDFLENDFGDFGILQVAEGEGVDDGAAPKKKRSAGDGNVEAFDKSERR